MTTEDPSSRTFPRRLYLGALSLLVLAALVLRLYHVGNRGFWQDEVDLWLAAVSDWRSNQMAPMMPWLMRGWIRWIGDPASVLSFHLPSVLLGAACVAPMALLGSELFSPAEGLAAAALIVVSPTALYYSQEARPYALLMNLSALTLWSFLRARRRGRWPSWILFGVLLAAGFLTHMLAMFIAAGLVFWTAIEAALERSTRPLLPVLAASLSAGLSLLWLFHRQKSVSGVMRGRYPYSLLVYLREVMVGLGTDSLLDNRAAPIVVGALILSVLAILGLRRLQHRTGRYWLLFPCIFVVYLTALFLNLGVMADWRWTRYLTPLVPFYLVLVAGGALSFRRAGKVVAVALAFVVLAPGFYRWAAGETWDRSWTARRFAAAIDEADGRLTGVALIVPWTVPMPIAYASLNFFRHDSRPTFFLARKTVFEMHLPPNSNGKVGWAERKPALPAGTYLIYAWPNNSGVATPPVFPGEMNALLDRQTAVRDNALSDRLGVDAYDIK